MFLYVLTSIKFWQRWSFIYKLKTERGFFNLIKIKGKSLLEKIRPYTVPIMERYNKFGEIGQYDYCSYVPPVALFFCTFISHKHVTIAFLFTTIKLSPCFFWLLFIYFFCWLKHFPFYLIFFLLSCVSVSSPFYNFISIF